MEATVFTGPFPLLTTHFLAGFTVLPPAPLASPSLLSTAPEVQPNLSSPLTLLRALSNTEHFIFNPKLHLPPPSLLLIPHTHTQAIISHRYFFPHTHRDPDHSAPFCPTLPWSCWHWAPHTDNSSNQHSRTRTCHGCPVPAPAPKTSGPSPLSEPSSNHYGLWPPSAGSALGCRHLTPHAKSLPQMETPSSPQPLSKMPALTNHSLS